MNELTHLLQKHRRTITLLLISFCMIVASVQISQSARMEDTKSFRVFAYQKEVHMLSGNSVDGFDIELVFEIGAQYGTGSYTFDIMGFNYTTGALKILQSGLQAGSCVLKAESGFDSGTYQFNVTGTDGEMIQDLAIVVLEIANGGGSFYVSKISDVKPDETPPLDETPSLSLTMSPNTKETEVGTPISMVFTPSGGTPPYTIEYSTIISYDDGTTEFGEKTQLAAIEAVEVPFDLSKPGEITLFANVTDSKGQKESALPTSLVIKNVDAPIEDPDMALTVVPDTNESTVGTPINVSFRPSGGTAPYTIEYSTIISYSDGTTEFGKETQIDTTAAVEVPFDLSKPGKITLFASVTDSKGQKESALPTSLVIKNVDAPIEDPDMALTVVPDTNESTVGTPINVSFRPSGGTPPYTIEYSTIISYSDDTTEFGEKIQVETSDAIDVAFDLKKPGEIALFASVTDSKGQKETAIPITLTIKKSNHSTPIPTPSPTPTPSPSPTPTPTPTPSSSPTPIPTPTPTPTPSPSPTPTPTPTPNPSPTPEPSTEPEHETGIKGDANNDKAIGIKDIISIVDYIVNRTKCPSMLNADCHEDGQVDLQDITWLINQIVED